MYNNYQTYTKFNADKIINILKDKNISLDKKQYSLEELFTFELNKLEDDKFIYNKKYIIFLKKLLNIDWLNIPGKTYFKEFYKVIDKDTFTKYILIKKLFQLKYIKCYSAEYLKNMLKYEFREFALYNEIIFVEKNTKVCKNQNKKVKTLEIETLERSLAYMVEYLKESKIIYYDEETYRFNLMDLPELTNQECLLLIEQKWPLIIPGKKYELENSYMGGYHLKKNLINISIFNIYIENDIIIKKNLLDMINKMQEKKYNLVKNNKIINFIEKLEEFFSPEILNKKEYSKYLEDWYACYQYLILIKSEVDEIYYPYTLDFRGRIYNGMSFGLNPTSNKLSRALINFGKVVVTEEIKINIKKYICSSFKIKINEFDKLLEINLDYNNNDNLKYLIDTYSLKSIVLLLDYKNNVLEKNETEILIELDASQSGFQILSMLSNDYLCMKNTNLIKSEEKMDLYMSVLNKLKEKVNIKWMNIINRNFIKRIIMTIPYGSTLKGQINMLVEEFKLQYSLTYLLEYNSLPCILENDIIINNLNLKNDLVLLNKKVEKFNITELSTNNIRKLDNSIYKKIGELENDLLDNLKRYFFKKIANIINEIILSLYPNILNFTKELKKLNLNKIETDYCYFSLNYYKEINNKIIVKTKSYTKSYVDYNKIDSRKTNISLIANICHGMGDAFIIHILIEKINIKFYCIHDAILCKLNEVEEIKKQILEAYKYVYNYYLNYKDFNLIINKNNYYELNSLDIFKI